MNDKVRQVVPGGLLLSLLMIVAAGCGSSNFNSPPPPPPAQLLSLSVTPAGPSIAPGTTRQFTVTGNYSGGAKQVLTTFATWTSSNTAIADIGNAAGSKGLATATTATGQTTITAAYSGVSGTTVLTVSPVVVMAITPASPPSIAPGTAMKLDVTGTLADSTLQTLTTWATWTSSNILVATISDTAGSKGLATATSPGPGGTVNATITATYTGVSGTATLTSSPLVSIAVTAPTHSIADGTTLQFAATGTLEDGNTQTLTTKATWSTSNSGVATISNISGSQGLATAVGVGTTAITASFPSVISDPSILEVSPAVLTSLTVTPVNPGIALGKTSQFSATGTFTDLHTQDMTASVTWDSSATTVAAISNSAGSMGLASSLAVGTTTIRATSGSISASTTLTVTPVALESITITPASATIGVNLSQQFFATGHFTDGSMQDLTTAVVWHSSNETIATISNTSGSHGIASTLFMPGSTNITATMSGVTSSTATLTVL